MYDPAHYEAGVIGTSRSLTNVSTAAAREKATEVRETLQQLQEFQSRAESGHGGEVTSRSRRAPDPRDPKASPVPGRAPPGQERASADSRRPPSSPFVSVSSTPDFSKYLRNCSRFESAA